MKLHVKMVLREIINKGAITMDHFHSNTMEDVRIPGRHLSLEERGMIQALHRQGLSLCTRLKRHNGMLRDFIPKGMSMERFSDEDILNMADTLNQRPRRVLGYHTPSELLMHSSMKFMLLSVFLDYSCSNSTCNLPTRVHEYIGSIYPLVC